MGNLYTKFSKNIKIRTYNYKNIYIYVDMGKKGKEDGHFLGPPEVVDLAEQVMDLVGDGGSCCRRAEGGDG